MNTIEIICTVISAAVAVIAAILGGVNICWTEKGCMLKTIRNFLI